MLDVSNVKNCNKLIQLQQTIVDEPATRAFIAQTELPKERKPVGDGLEVTTICWETVREWINDVQSRHELPVGWRWSLVTEDSDLFFVMPVERGRSFTYG